MICMKRNAPLTIIRIPVFEISLSLLVKQLLKSVVKLGLISGVCISLADATVLKVGFQDNDASPTLIGNGPELADPPGISVDILKLAVKDLNIRLNIIRRPNQRVHHDLKTGRFDLSGIYSFKPSRMEEGVFPRTESGELDKDRRVFTQSYYMYAYSYSDFEWNGNAVSQGSLVGANLGYSVVSDLKKLNISVFEAKTVKQNLQMLKAGRIHAYAAQNTTLDPIIQHYPEWQQLRKVGPSIKTKAYYFVFSHRFYQDNKELAEKIWDNIGRVREQVLERYRQMSIKPKIQ